MRIARIYFLIALLACLPAAGGEFIHAKTITAQMIVDAIRRPEDRPSVHEHYEALGYLRGTKDNVNVKWCPPVGLANLEIDGQIVAYLANLPEKARQREAGPQIAAALRSKFPCIPKKARRNETLRPSAKL